MPNGWGGEKVQIGYEEDLGGGPSGEEVGVVKVHL